MKRILIPLADGCEELEAVTLIDLLRRADCEVMVAGLNGNEPITASRGVRLIPDNRWEALDLLSYDALVLPGGLEGTEALCRHDGVQEALRVFDIEEKLLGAICAAPLALHTAGVLERRAFTCYPGIERRMSRTDRSPDSVVRDGHVMTGQGPGAAIDFSLALIEHLLTPAQARTVRDGVLPPSPA